MTLEPIRKFSRSSLFDYVRSRSIPEGCKNTHTQKAAVLFPTVSLLYRIKIEEAALVQGIGAEYAEYKKKTKKLIHMMW